MADEENREDIDEQHKQETLEFEKIKDDLEKYGQIMQACIEEAEKTLQIWRGREMTAYNDHVCLAMMPAVSVALFERVTKSAELRDESKFFIRQIAVRSFLSIYAKHMDKILTDIKLGRYSEDEGAEP